MVDGPRPGVDGHFAIAINVAAFQDLSTVRSRVDAIIREARISAPARDGNRLYVPGEIEGELERSNRASGIPLNDATLRDILTVAREVGADVSSLAELVGHLERTSK
jgi:LDH2 family malate/lactate/ureidoglycolate dehydrogenase